MTLADLSSRPTRIQLEWFELWSACGVGVLRQVLSMQDGRKKRFGKDDWMLEMQKHIAGAGGEAVVGKVLGIYWPGSVNTFKSQPDVGRFEVRTRLHRPDPPRPELIVREDDPDDTIFIHVVTCPKAARVGKSQRAQFDVWGWINSDDAKVEKYKNNHGGHGDAYFVPYEALLPMSMLAARTSRN